MVKPRALVPGDRLAIVAPASPFDRQEFEDGLQEVRRLGFEPVYDESIFARRGYVAGTPRVRAAAIHAAWSDPTVAGLLCVRGGYGSAQVAPLLDPAAARRARKVFVGYSDITALLTYHTVSCGVVAFHGPMLAQRLGRGAAGYDQHSFLRVLCDASPLGELSPAGIEVLRPGEVRGPLMGGTLTQLVASLGTPYAFAPNADYVLFLEDVSERPYRIDRMVTQMRQAGLLKRARGIVIGEMRECDEPSGDPTAKSALAEIFADFPGPVISGFPSGHTVGPLFTLPLGVECRVIADAVPRLVVEEAAVDAA